MGQKLIDKLFFLEFVLEDVEQSIKNFEFVTGHRALGFMEKNMHTHTKYPTNTKNKHKISSNNSNKTPNNRNNKCKLTLVSKKC